LAYLRIRPNSGGIVPRMPTTPARQWSGSSQSEFLVVHGRRAEVPDIGAVVAGQQAEAAHLVAFPLADLGRRDVADVVDVKQQQRARIRVLQRLPRPAEAIAAQPVMIDPAFEIDRGVAPGGQPVFPFPVGFEVLRLSDVRHQGTRHDFLLRARLRAPVSFVESLAGRYWMHQPPSMWIIWPVM
jgi:hypothetical protein